MAMGPPFACERAAGKFTASNHDVIKNPKRPQEAPICVCLLLYMQDGRDLGLKESGCSVMPVNCGSTDLDSLPGEAPALFGCTKVKQLYIHGKWIFTCGYTISISKCFSVL